MSGLMGIIACWKPQDRGSCLIRDVCLASLGVGVGFVLKGQWAQPKRETRSARENEPAAREDNQMRVAKMVREDEPTTLEDPSVWRSASVREHEPTEKKIARENEPATTRRARKDEPAPEVNIWDPSRQPFDHCPMGCPLLLGLGQKQDEVPAMPWPERPSGLVQNSVEEEPEDFWEVTFALRRQGSWRSASICSDGTGTFNRIRQLCRLGSTSTCWKTGG